MNLATGIRNTVLPIQYPFSPPTNLAYATCHLIQRCSLINKTSILSVYIIEPLFWAHCTRIKRAMQQCLWFFNLGSTSCAFPNCAVHWRGKPEPEQPQVPLAEKSCLIGGASVVTHQQKEPKNFRTNIWLYFQLADKNGYGRIESNQWPGSLGKVNLKLTGVFFRSISIRPN